MVNPGTFLQALDAVVSVFRNRDHIKANMTGGDILKNTLTAVADTSSLTDIAKLARVEPLAIVSRDCMTLDYLPDVMTTLLNIFIGYYLQAVSIGGRVDSVKVIKILDRLNPDRDHTGAILMASAMETLRDMPTMNINEYEYRLPMHTAMEDNRGAEPYFTATDKSKKVELGGETDLEATGSKVGDIRKTLTESANLAVGKIINVDINVSRRQSETEYSEKGTITTKQNGDKETRQSMNENRENSIASSTVSIPVMVRLSPSLLPSNSIVKMLTLESEDNTFIERYHAWRSGRISFIRDLVLCQDMIDEHKKALLHDEQGTYSEIMRRVANSRKFGLITQNPSMAVASNLIVISQDVALEVEKKLGGKLSNPRIREYAFNSTYAMIIAVIDTRYNRVTFYHRGIATATDVSIRELVQASKGKGPDIMDIFKAYQLGNAPSY
jgi:hypothetical protein